MTTRSRAAYSRATISLLPVLTRITGAARHNLRGGLSLWTRDLGNNLLTSGGTLRFKIMIRKENRLQLRDHSRPRDAHD